MLEIGHPAQIVILYPVGWVSEFKISVTDSVFNSKQEGLLIVKVCQVTSPLADWKPPLQKHVIYKEDNLQVVTETDGFTEFDIVPFTEINTECYDYKLMKDGVEFPNSKVNMN